ncbi:Mth938-like domain-containing protein [Sphingomonas gellani]|nr:MTH938/NDUFAF3 family protein [Sphingomonas gellani]
MDLERSAAGPLVTGFSGSGFRIGDTVFPALLMTVEAALPWTPPSLSALALEDLQPLIDARPEFILLGTGHALTRPSPLVSRGLEARGIGLEVMDSRAAARAWGVLRGEGRIIAAALYPLS